MNKITNAVKSPSISKCQNISLNLPTIKPNGGHTHSRAHKKSKILKCDINRLSKLNPSENYRFTLQLNTHRTVAIIPN